MVATDARKARRLAAIAAAGGDTTAAAVATSHAKPAAAAKSVAPRDWSDAPSTDAAPSIAADAAPKAAGMAYSRTRLFAHNAPVHRTPLPPPPPLCVLRRPVTVYAWCTSTPPPPPPPCLLPPAGLPCYLSISVSRHSKPSSHHFTSTYPTEYLKLSWENSHVRPWVRAQVAARTWAAPSWAGTTHRRPSCARWPTRRKTRAATAPRWRPPRRRPERPRPTGQGLTLVHFSAQHEQLLSLTDRNHPIYVTRSAYIEPNSGRV